MKKEIEISEVEVAGLSRMCMGSPMGVDQYISHIIKQLARRGRRLIEEDKKREQGLIEREAALARKAEEDRLVELIRRASSDTLQQVGRVLDSNATNKEVI